MTEYEFVSYSPDETEAIGRRLAAIMGRRTLIGLYGELGAGKTVLIRGLARALGYTGAVTSPTFALVNEYQTAGRTVLCHFDLCRIGADDLEDIGWTDYLRTGVPMAAEWAENAAEEFADAVSVTVTGSGDAPRRIRIAVPDGEDPKADPGRKVI